MKINTFLKSGEFDNNPCCYIYDLNKLKSKIKILNDKGKQFFYSVKCNPHERVLNCISSNSDIGAEVVSEEEFRISLKHFNSNKIICGGIAKSDLYLKLISEKNPYKVVLDSLEEAKRFDKYLSKRTKVLIRVSFKDSRFGIPIEDLKETVDKINQLDFIEVEGIHNHEKNNCLDWRELLLHHKKVINSTELDIINLGGGFGVDYKGEFDFDIDRYFDVLQTDKNLIYEIGRYLVAECGYYYVKVLDLKEDNIITSGGIHSMARYFITKQNVPFKIFNLDTSSSPKVYNRRINISGSTCTVEDILAFNVLVDKVSIGDIIVFEMVGGYSHTISLINFNSLPEPMEIFRE
jgi:diaminopimelate decarboxylase